MGGWRELDFRVVELEGLASEQLRHALSDQLIAEPFGVAEVRPAVAPVWLEPVRAVDALEARHIAEERCEPRHKCMDRPGPLMGLACFICVVAVLDGHGRDYKAANTPADLAPAFPQSSRRK